MSTFDTFFDYKYLVNVLDYATSLQLNLGSHLGSRLGSQSGIHKLKLEPIWDPKRDPQIETGFCRQNCNTEVAHTVLDTAT